MSGGRRHPPNPPGLHILCAGVAAELVRTARIGPDDVVVDLGAGTGSLTGPLARTGARVLAVEHEPALASRLRGRFAATGSVRVVERDLRSFVPPRRPYRVVANPPFSLAMTVLGRLLDGTGTRLRRADVVLPLDLAVRLARPRATGRRDRRWRQRYSFRIDRRLGRSAFRPEPSVTTAVLVIEPHRHPK